MLFLSYQNSWGEITTVNLNLVLDNSILDTAPKAQAKKEKLDKLNFSELNICVLVHTSSRNKNVLH